MNAYEKAVSLGLTGTSAEQVAVLANLTVSDVAVETVAAWLRENALWYRSGPTQMAGSLQVIADNDQTPQTVKDGLGILYSAVFGRGAATLRTTDPHWAGVVASILTGLASVDPSLALLEDSFYALDGGRPYKETTVAEFEAQQTAAALEAEAAENRRVRQAALAEANDTAFNAIETTPTIAQADLLAAFTTRLGEVWP